MHCPHDHTGGYTMKHGKHYVDAAKQVDFTKLYDMNEALELACKTASAKFD